MVLGQKSFLVLKGLTVLVKIRGSLDIIHRYLLTETMSIYSRSLDDDMVYHGGQSLFHNTWSFKFSHLKYNLRELCVYVVFFPLCSFENLHYLYK